MPLLSAIRIGDSKSLRDEFRLPWGVRTLSDQNQSVNTSFVILPTYYENVKRTAPQLSVETDLDIVGKSYKHLEAVRLLILTIRIAVGAS